MTNTQFSLIHVQNCPRVNKYCPILHVWPNTNHLKKSRTIVIDFRFHFVVSSRVFVLEQFVIRRWKANQNTNLMMVQHLKIGRLQPEKSCNMFERIQILKKIRVCALYSVQYIHSNPCTVMPTVMQNRTIFVKSMAILDMKKW